MAISTPTDSVPRESRRLFLVASACIALLYGTLAITLTQTRLPWIDEAWVANPAWNLLHHGKMVTTFFESANPDSNQTFSQATYWMPPAWFVIEASWFSIVGAGLTQQRLLSTLFGALLLVALYVLSARLTGSKRIGLLASFFLAVDFVFLERAADGRMDVAASALLVSCYALYLWLREKHLPVALLAANSVLMIAGLTHPIAIVGCGGLLCLVLLFDRKNLRWSHLAWSLIPYVVGAVAWGIYIARDPSTFVHQFFGKTPAPNFGFLTAFSLEIQTRYRHIYGIDADWNIASWPQFLVGLTYACAGVAVVLVALCTRNSHWVRSAALWATHFLALTMIISLKADYHLPSIVPLYALLVALCIDALLGTRGWRIAAVGGAAALLALQFRIVVRKIQIDPFQSYFIPALAHVEAIPASEFVSAPPEFAYALGFPPHVIHDYHFGFYSGRKPDLVVSRQSIAISNPAAQRTAERLYIEELFAQQYYLDRVIGMYSLYRPVKSRSANSASITNPSNAIR